MLTQASAPVYQFLSQPPPQKKRPVPTQPLPSPPHGSTHDTAHASPSPPQLPVRKRSNTTSAISAWAAAVQPGSPAPCSPPARRSSVSRRPSVGRGRPSLGRARKASITSQRVPSASFLSLTPSTAQTHSINLSPGGPAPKTPSTADGFELLVYAGYSSAFIRVPVPPTPVTDAIPSSNGADFKHIPLPPAPASPAKSQAKSKGRGMRLRSLSVFKRGRSKSVASAAPTSGSDPTPPITPTKPAKKAAAAASSEQRAASIAARKRKKYPKLPAPLPLSLAQEAELAQLLDGGSTRANVGRVMRDKAIARGAHVGADGAVEGVAVALRDERGAWWEDVEEQDEFAPLLAGAGDAASPAAQWVEFHSAASPVEAAADERRGSVSSATTASSADSELDPRYRVLPPPDSADDLALFGFASSDNAVAPRPGASILALPARPRRAAPHLRRPALLRDAFVAPPRSPRSPKSPKSPRSPRSPRLAHAVSRPKGRARRRPAPLTLAPPCPARKRAVNGQPTAELRQDFLADSFAPAPARVRAPVPRAAPLSIVRAHHVDPVEATKVISHKPSVWKLLRKVRA
jgi:hypothetical protein